MINYIKKYISIYERMHEIYHPNSKPMDFSKGMYPRHEKGSVDFWGAKPISRPAVLGRIMRMRRHRVGQMELFCKIKPKKRIEKEHYNKVYC